MRKLLVLLVLCLMAGGVSATPVNFTEWTPYGDAWKANNDTHTLVMWNLTGSHNWIASGNATSVNYLVVAGGGGGGNLSAGGGGGAGGLLNGSLSGLSGSINVVVGAGGYSSSGSQGGDGANSTFGSISAKGGGGGGIDGYGSPIGSGRPGGSGGGARANTGGTGGAGISGQGYRGGNTAVGKEATGGGGASEIGADSSLNTGVGGNGTFSSITGVAIQYAGGGGGNYGSGITHPRGGGGGGGQGCNISNIGSTQGTDGLGGGGGGGAVASRGGSGVVIISYLTPSGVSTASFTCTPTTAMLGESIACTDTSSDTPTNWTYYWGDGNVTDGTQNPSYTYPFTGTFSINQTVNNTAGESWYNRSNYITVSNATGFTQQDLWQTGHYTITLNVKDSSNAPIPVVTVTDSNGQSYTTTNGTAFFTEDAGATVFYFASTGYVSKAMSYIVDEDATHTVQMVTAIDPANQNTWWTPHTVQITLMDASYGFRLVDVAINATYNESSMPTEWITQLYGIQSTPGADMIDKSLRLGGTTGSDGTLTTTMLGSLKYDIYLTSTEYGLNNYHVQAYPSDSMLNIYVVTEGTTLPTNKNSTYTGLNGTRVYFTEPDINNVTMCIDYIDSTGNTLYVNDTWLYQNNNTVFYTSNFTPGTALNTSCYTLPNVRGTAVWWGYNATRGTA